MDEQLSPAPSPFDGDDFIEEVEEEEVEEEEVEEELSDDELEESPDDSDEDEPEDEDDSEDENEPEDDGEEEVEEVQTVPHAALHKERERRKEVQSHLQEANTYLQELSKSVVDYEQQLSGIKKQLKELDLEDIVDVKEPTGTTKELLDQRAAKEAQRQEQIALNTVMELKQEAALHLDEFPMIDGNDPEQAELVLGFAYAASMMGGDKEEAVMKAMGILNKHLAGAKKSAIRGNPAPRRKTASSKVASKPKTNNRVQQAIKSGNVKNVFDNYFE